jgi:hypothetical protein
MSYIKDRIQIKNHAAGGWDLIDTSTAKVVGHKAEKYPYVRRIRIHKGTRK